MRVFYRTSYLGAFSRRSIGPSGFRLRAQWLLWWLLWLLWLRGPALQLRGSRIRLRSGRTVHWWIDRYYRDARSGLHSATGGVRVCHAADI
jgi:hypothetical protein